MFAFGIEHEVAFLDRKKRFVDFTNTSFADLAAIVDALPFYEEDYPQLRIGDAGIKYKRWYIEGFERYNNAGQVVACPPKGIEIRTTIRSTIMGAVAELATSFQQLATRARTAGLTPVCISFHPYHKTFVPDPPLNDYEQSRRQLSPEKQTALLPMLTYGPDLNLSLQGLSTADIITLGQKLTYYSPFIIPFSYSSPFYHGELWEGLSIRTFVRTGVRPATMVFLGRAEDLLASNPSLTKIARIPAEEGRIEFKACDSCANFAIYAGLLALLKGLVLDQTLTGKALVPDAALHQLSARQGFSSQEITEGTWQILQAAEHALQADPDRHLLNLLRTMLISRRTPAHDLIQSFQQTGSIEGTLYSSYAQINT
ncbi:hypothetical protein KDW_54220 [Dictyobacter vulcani]|uniref:Glutamate--cysteine ligase n=1 Tax=Dictyobacter vulcani TaxID=2607529 RepID=A0A5J4KXI1_9CHLR|nr:glutamate-cysteine ligase family protein [Dictyobacter vulcani]GER91260.1 hypothetical protein KDW_54220 [Dictyobacter vulcani]